MFTFWQRLSGKPRNVSWLCRHRHIEGLVNLLPDTELGGQALAALGQLRDPTAVPSILAFFTGKDWHLYVEAVRCLAQIGDERALKYLIRALDARTALPPDYQDQEYVSEFRSAIASGLKHFDTDPAVDTLIELLENADPAVRRESVISLSHLNYEDGLLEVGKLLGHEQDAQVITAIEQVLGLEAYRTAAELLEKRGFTLLSSVHYMLDSKIYWHPELKVELMVTQSGDWYILKGMKKYYIKAVSESGQETWQRNLGELMEKLRVSFPEFHLYACGAMNILPEMVPQDANRIEQERKVRQLQTTLESQAKALEEFEERMSRAKERVYRKLEEAGSPQAQLEDVVRGTIGGAADKVLKGSGDYIRGPTSEEKQAARWQTLSSLDETADQARAEYEKAMQETEKQLKQEHAHLKELIEQEHALVNQYIQKGAATCYVIGCSTNLRIGTLQEFKAMLDQTLEDIKVAHTYGGFTQSLERGLHIYHEEVKFPWITHTAEAVGILAPDQLQHPALHEIRDQVLSQFMLTAAEDIVLGGQVKEKAKRTPARVFQAFMEKVHKVSDESIVPAEVLPLEGGWVGNLMYAEELTDKPFFFPMHQLKHGYISGTTGSGKTYTARVLVENALIEGINVIILDPTRQWCGLAFPATAGRRRMRTLGVEQEIRRGFPVAIYTPGSEAGLKMPHDPSELLKGCHVVTMKGLDDQQRCRIAKDILQVAYDSAQEETEKLRTLIVLEEAHNLLPDNVLESAQSQAEEVRTLIDRISREKRKYGLNLLLISQSLTDFKREARVVREMTNSKFFMRAIDHTEIEYVAGYVSPEAAELVKALKPGEALIHSPLFRPAKVFIRSPFSDVHEPSDAQIQSAMERFMRKERFIRKAQGQNELSEDEQRLLELARQYLQEHGEAINISQASQTLQIANPRKMNRLIESLQQKNLIRIETAPKRGNPKLIIPC